MKNTAVSIGVGLLGGLALGLLVATVLFGRKVEETTTATPNVGLKEPESDQKLIALGKLYPAELSLRISKNLRIIAMLDENQPSNARMTLYQDIESNVSSLSALERELNLNPQQKQSLNDGRAFLKGRPK